MAEERGKSKRAKGRSVGVNLWVRIRLIIIGCILGLKDFMKTASYFSYKYHGITLHFLTRTETRKINYLLTVQGNPALSRMYGSIYFAV